MPIVLAELRKELREIRKSMVKPVSRMLKHEVLSELEKHRPRSDSTKKSEPEPEPKKAVPKKTITKAEEKVEKVVSETSAPKKVVRKAVEKVATAEKKSKK